MKVHARHEVRIRLALASEHKALEAIQLRASLNNPGDRGALLANPSANEFPLEQITEGRVFVAETAGFIKGFAAVVRREDGNIDLDALFVEPETWRQGVGRKLVDFCAFAAFANGAKAMHVIGNPHAEGFYEACGFEMLGTEKTQFGIGLLMCKLLSA